MKKTIIASLLAVGFAAPAFAQESPHSVSYNVGVVSDYLFRGISQSQGKPALQGGIDYAHTSGLYAGAWGSTIKWIDSAMDPDNTAKTDYPFELDLYGGYKNSISDDLSYDVGVITYNYRGKNRPNTWVSPFTAEAYGALTWKWFTVKYSHVISKNFVAWGLPEAGTGSTKSGGSGYLELNGAYDLGDGWGLSGHIGYQKVKNFTSINDKGGDDASYTDVNVGVTKDVGFGVVGLKYSKTNADNCGSNTEAYCWDGRSAGKSRAVLSFSKAF